MTPDLAAQTAPVVLITGAARRIGAAIARHMHSAGYNIVIHCNQSIDAADTLCAEFNALRPDSARTLQAQLTDMAQVKKLAKDTLSCWGRIDALVNNASSFYSTPLAKATEADWDTLIGSNLKGPYFLCRELAETLSEVRGAIVNIADIHARQPLAEHSIYCIAKAGNVMLTKTLAKELAPVVRVNGIAPGAILWPENNGEMNAQSQQNILNNIPLGKLGDELDIARLAHFLITDASYVNGQVIAVDGGSHLS
ncbi:MAG: pteridine reductase [Porticoccaceae bacterium]|nr:pteridine reductase [Porticoccaceae bacterium]